MPVMVVDVHTKHGAPGDFEHGTDRLDVRRLEVLAFGGPLLLEHLLVEGNVPTKEGVRW